MARESPVTPKEFDADKLLKERLSVADERWEHAEEDNKVALRKLKRQPVFIALQYGLSVLKDHKFSDIEIEEHTRQEYYLDDGVICALSTNIYYDDEHCLSIEFLNEGLRVRAMEDYRQPVPYDLVSVPNILKHIYDVAIDLCWISEDGSHREAWVEEEAVAEDEPEDTIQPDDPLVRDINSIVPHGSEATPYKSPAQILVAAVGLAGLADDDKARNDYREVLESNAARYDGADDLAHLVLGIFAYAHRYGLNPVPKQ